MFKKTTTASKTHILSSLISELIVNKETTPRHPPPAIICRLIFQKTEIKSAANIVIEAPKTSAKTILLATFFRLIDFLTNKNKSACKIK